MSSGTLKFTIIGIELAAILVLSWLLYRANQKFEALSTEFDLLISQKYQIKSSLDSAMLSNALLHDEISDKDEKLVTLRNEKLQLESIIQANSEEMANLEKTIARHEATIARYRSIGVSEDVQEYIEELQQKLGEAKSERDAIRLERNKIIEDYNELKQIIQDRDSEIKSLKESHIPYLEAKVKRLNEELSVQHQINAVANIRADIENIELDYTNNVILFNLRFSYEEIAILKSLNRRELTFAPLIENMSSTPFFQIAIDGPMERAYKIDVYELENNTQFKIKLGSPNLKSLYKRKEPINLDSGDQIKIDIRVDELENFTIAQTLFRIKK